MEYISSILKRLKIIEKIPILHKLLYKYLKLKTPIVISDLNFETKYSNSYTLISEKDSFIFKNKIIKRLKSYLGTGPIGESKLWEYPWVLANLRLKKGLSILDVGCGKSPLQYLLSDLGMSVYGIDPSINTEWHGIDTKKAKMFNCDIHYRKESGDNISFEDNYFDRVICVSVIEHCRTVDEKICNRIPLTKKDSELHKKIMTEMIRVLKPKGLCIVTVDFYFPSKLILLESNINVKNLIDIEGAELYGNKIELAFPGEKDFNYKNILNYNEIHITKFPKYLQTSIGFTLQKK
ncbi:MAG: class I SAM-dependent methyltransferase [Candidatus Lokiarchaeota archaeon]|nr:class I SAM-dependent methyltransferase [Candidatus Lokiarchaeota archaeon]